MLALGNLPGQELPPDGCQIGGPSYAKPAEVLDNHGKNQGPAILFHGTTWPGCIIR